MSGLWGAREVDSSEGCVSEVVRNGWVDVCKLEVGLGWSHRPGVEHRGEMNLGCFLGFSLEHKEDASVFF